MGEPFLLLFLGSEQALPWLYHIQLPVAVRCCHLVLWLEPSAGSLEEALDGHVEGLQLCGLPGSTVLDLSPAVLLGDTRHVPAKLLQQQNSGLETPNSTLTGAGRAQPCPGLELVQSNVVGADPGASPAKLQLLQCSPWHVLPARTVPFCVLPARTVPSPQQGQIPCSSTATVTSQTCCCFQLFLMTNLLHTWALPPHSWRDGIRHLLPAQTLLLGPAMSPWLQEEPAATPDSARPWRAPPATSQLFTHWRMSL